MPIQTESDAAMRVVETCAEHFATTAMFNVPKSLTPRRFSELVQGRFKAILEERVKEHEARERRMRP